MTIGCNIWMICLKLNRFFYGLSRMLHLSEFEWTFLGISRFLTIFLLIDATDRSKISSDQKCFFIALSLHPLSFFANTPFKYQGYRCESGHWHICMKGHHLNLPSKPTVCIYSCRISLIFPAFLLTDIISRRGVL